MKRKFKKKTFFIWLTMTFVLLIFFGLNKEYIDILLIQEFVGQNKIFIAIIYVFLLSILGLFFIPSTPFAMAGVILFSPLEAYLLNLIGIVTPSFIVYHFAKFLSLDKVFEKKYPNKIKKLKGALQNKELPIIAIWSFLPIVPTDMIIYVASTLKISIKKSILGVIIGEGTLNLFYIFFTGSIFGL